MKLKQKKNEISNIDTKQAWPCMSFIKSTYLGSKHNKKKNNSSKLSGLQAWRSTWSNHWWCHLNIFFIEKIDIFLHGSHLRVILRCIEIVVVFRLKERRIQSCSGVVWCSVVFGLKEERRWSRHGAYVKVVQRFGGRKKMKLLWGYMVLHGAWFWERERWVWVIEKNERMVVLWSFASKVILWWNFGKEMKMKDDWWVVLCSAVGVVEFMGCSEKEWQ